MSSDWRSNCRDREERSVPGLLGWEEGCRGKWLLAGEGALITHPEGEAEQLSEQTKTNAEVGNQETIAAVG